MYLCKYLSMLKNKKLFLFLNRNNKNYFVKTINCKGKNTKDKQ